MRVLAWLILALAAFPAAACTYARNVQPERWSEWAAALFTGEVTAVRAGEISLRVGETFKGPAAAETATVRMPERVRIACGLALPRAGDELLVGLDPQGNAAWVPLKPAYLDALRRK